DDRGRAARAPRHRRPLGDSSALDGQQAGAAKGVDEIELVLGLREAVVGDDRQPRAAGGEPLGRRAQVAYDRVEPLEHREDLAAEGPRLMLLVVERDEM